MDDIVFNGTGGMWEGNIGKASVSVNTPGVLAFNGSSDYISVADHDDFSFGDGSSDSPFTVSAWIKADDLTNFPIVCKGVYNSTGEWFFQTNSGQKLEFYLSDESVADNYIGRYHNVDLTSAHQGIWMHVCATYNGDESDPMAGIKLYINGVEVAGTNMSGNGSSYVAMENGGGDLHIGRSASIYADGRIADVKIYNSELSALDVGRLASHIGVNNLAVQDTDTRIFDTSLLIHHSGSKLDGAHNDSTTTIVNLESNKAELAHTEESNFVDNNNQRIVIGNEVMVVTGVAQVNAYTETNSFSSTDGTTPGTVNIDGVAITITASQTAAQVAALVAAGDYPNYNAAVTNTDKVTFTHKGLGAKTHGAITMSDAVYVKTGGGNHTITAGSFANGSTNLTVSGRSGAALHGTTAAAHSDNDDIYIIGLEDLSTQSHAPVLNGDISSPITHADFDQFEFMIMPGFGVGADTTKNMVESLTATETAANLTNGHGAAFQVGEIITMADGGGQSGEFMKITAIDVSGDPDVLTLQRGVGGTQTGTNASVPAGVSHDNPSDIYYANVTYSAGPVTLRQGKVNCGGLSHLTFDGTADDVDIGTVERGAEDTTVAMWINADDMQQNRLIGDDGGSSHDYIRFKDNNNTKLKISVNNANLDITGLSGMPTGKWFHLAVSHKYSNGDVKAWINGVKEFDATGLGNNQPWTLNRIGGDTTDYHDGELKDIRIFDSLLSDGQVKAIYAGDSPYVPMHWWKMDEGSGSTIEDYGSGSDADGSFNGDTAWVNTTVDFDYDGSTNDCLSVGSKAELIAPRGKIQVQYDISQQGLFTHNSGTFEFTDSCSMRGDDNWTGTSAFNNVIITNNSTYVSQDSVDVDIEGDVSGAGGLSIYHNATITLGTASRACAYDAGLLRMWTTYSSSTLQGKAQLFPAVINTNTDLLWTNMNNSHNFTWKWLDFRRDIDTANGDQLPNDLNLIIGGDCFFTDLEVASGADLDLNGQRAELSGTLTLASGSNFDADGMLIIDNISETSSTITNEASCDIIITGGKATGSHDFSADVFRTKFFNGLGEVNFSNANGLTSTKCIIANASDGVDLDGNAASCTNLTIATGGTLEMNGSEVTIGGDLTTTGGLIGKSAMVVSGDNDYEGMVVTELQSQGDWNFSGAEGITIEGWFKFDDLDFGSGNDAILAGMVRSGDTTGKRYGLGLQIMDDKVMAIAANNDTAHTHYDNCSFPVTDMTAGKWHHLAMTVDANNSSTPVTKLYLDGKLKKQVTGVTAIHYNYNFVVGGYADNHDGQGWTNRRMDGTIARVSCFRQEMTEAQLRSMLFSTYTEMAALSGGVDEAKCVGWWQFDEGTGTAVDNKGTAGDYSSEDGAIASAGTTWTGAGTLTFDLHLSAQNAGSTSTNYGNSGVLIMNGAGASLNYITGEVLPHLNIANTSGTITANAISGTNNLTVASLTTEGGSSEFTAPTGTLTINGENSDGMAFELGHYGSADPSTFKHGNGTVTFNSHSNPTIHGVMVSGQSTATDGLYNVILDGANTKVGVYSGSNATYIYNNYTHTNGNLISNSAGNSFTVIGDVLLSAGNMFNTGNAPTGAHAYKSLTISSGATYKATTGTTTISGKNGSNYIMQIGGLFTHSGGTVKIDTSVTGDKLLDLIPSSGVGLNHLIVNEDGSGGVQYNGNTTIAGDLTIEEGIFQFYDNNNSNLTVLGNVDVESGGQLGAAGWVGAGEFDSLTISGGGTYEATSGTTAIKNRTGGGYSWYAPSDSHVYHHNNGKTIFDLSATLDNDTYVRGNYWYDLEIKLHDDKEWRYSDIDGEGLIAYNDFTITSGRLKFDTAGDPITVHGLTTLETDGQFGLNSPSGVHTFHKLVTINGGTWYTSSGTNNMAGIRKLGGTLS